MIGIYAPYGRNEITAAALALADLAVSLGLDVTFIATDAQESNVHPFWDARVRSGRGCSAFDSAKGCKHVIHFQCREDLLSVARLAAPKAHQTLVPSIHTMTREDTRTVHGFDSVVCAAREHHTAFRQSYWADDKPEFLSWVRWDAGLPSVRRESRISAEHLCVCVYGDSSSIDFAGSMVLGLVDELLQELLSLRVTLLSTKSWSRHDRREISRLLKRWPGRLSTRKAGSLAEQSQAFHEHDWVILPSIRATFGMTGLRALACGTPVVCYAIPPYNEIVASGHNGVIMPCAIRSNWMKVSSAVPNMSRSAQVCTQVFSQPDQLQKLKARDWQLDQHARVFRDFWAARWGS